MICRIKPEHQSPVEPYGWIAGTFILEKSPYIRDWGDYTIMDMRRGLCRISAFTKCSNLLLRTDKLAGFCIYCMKMQIHVYSPFWSQNYYTITGLTAIFTGKKDYATGL